MTHYHQAVENFHSTPNHTQVHTLIWHTHYNIYLWLSLFMISFCCLVFAGGTGETDSSYKSSRYTESETKSQNQLAHNQTKQETKEEQVSGSKPLSTQEVMNTPKRQVTNKHLHISPKLFFPLSQAPLYSFTTGGREFGASRDWGARYHAGVDLVQRPGQSIHAITDGKIIDFYYFYDGTYAVVVDHKDFVIRYGEVSYMSPRVQVGDQVKAGDKIARIGLHHRSGSAMLHLEKYTGELSGPLTQYHTRFLRRKDLVDPTEFVHDLEGSWPNTKH